jgi:hypothetical protein
MERFTDELLPRDMLTKEIYKQMEKDETEHVWEDLRTIPAKELKNHFPNILAHCKEKNYDAEIGAICWMQGESDTTDFKASHYYENQMAFASYLREDLAEYAADGGIYFIDAGISNSPYCEPAYPEINEAKEKFAEQSEMNLYFSTIDLGFTIHKEPEGEPDWGHYDSLSELALGRKFGELVVNTYSMR